MIPILEPLFAGNRAVCGESLEHVLCFPGNAVTVTELLSDSALFNGALHRYADHLGIQGKDLRAAASSWSLDYLWALLPPVVSATSILQHVFPVSPAEMAVTLDKNGVPLRFHIRHEGLAAPGDSCTTRYAPLIWQHLTPLFATIRCHARLPEKILWGNAARYMDGILEQALLLTRNAAQVIEDRDHLLFNPLWLEGESNPLYMRQRQIAHIENGIPSRHKLHRQCCLSYRLPGRDYCSACPLAPKKPSGSIECRV